LRGGNQQPVQRGGRKIGGQNLLPGEVGLSDPVQQGDGLVHLSHPGVEQRQGVQRLGPQPAAGPGDQAGNDAHADDRVGAAPRCLGPGAGKAGAHFVQRGACGQQGLRGVEVGEDRKDAGAFGKDRSHAAGQHRARSGWPMVSAVSTASSMGVAIRVKGTGGQVEGLTQQGAGLFGGAAAVAKRRA
jgi:hypothetical protein